MEHKQQIVGADGRVLGEQDEECQDASRHSCGKEQHEVYSPKRFLSAYAVKGGGCGQYKQQQGGLQRGESFGRLSIPVVMIFSSFSTRGRTCLSLPMIRAVLK